MKNLICLFAVAVLSLGLVGCDPEAAETDGSSTGGGGAPASKATLSRWQVSNNAWAIRLDLAGANLTGSSFSMTIKFADNSETHCTAVIVGDDSSGSYNISNCVDDVNGTMSYSVGNGGSPFITGGTGSYTNSGAAFRWCRANNACFTYL